MLPVIKKCFRFFLLGWMMFSMALYTRAAEYHYSSSDSGVEAVQENWENLMTALPEDVRRELEGISFRSLSDTADTLSQKTDIRYWLKFLLAQFGFSLREMSSKIPLLFALMLFMAAVQNLLPSVSGNMQKTFNTYTGLVSALILYHQTFDLLAVVRTGLDRLCRIMNFITPVMEAVYLSSGALTQRAVSAQAVVLFVTAAGNFTGYFLTPMTQLLFTFSAAASVCDEAKLTPLVGSLRKFIMRLIQLFTMFFSFMLASQSILAKSADSLGMKTARFALGSFIPIAGGTLAEALSTLREGMSLIKSTAGVGGILVIFLLVLPDILQLGINKFFLSLIGTGAELLKLDKFAALIREIHGIIELLLAIVLFTALLFVLILILFIKAQVNA